MLEERLPTLAELGIDDPDRVCPMLAGPAIINGDHLTVRLAEGDVDVDAPKALLRDVFNLCDGTRSLNELLATITDEAKREQLSDFMAFLLDCGALVDSSYFTLSAMRFAWGNNPFGQAALDDASERIGKRFRRASSKSDTHERVPGAITRHIRQHTLSPQFESRESSYLFGGKPAKQGDLDKVLWSMAGIVCDTRMRGAALMPRRTIASAGAMHLVEIYVALRYRTGNGKHDLAPGVYRVRYPGAYQVSYEKVSDDISLLPRSVAKPWSLESAAGMIFLLADARLAALRYRNRSVQYLYTEAGMALQNATLTAADLDLSFVTFGSYYESYVRTLCGGTDQLVVGSAIFGTAASARQKRTLDNVAEVEFAWADAPAEGYTLPYYVGRAQLKHGAPDSPTWGRDADPALAYRKTVAEAIERQGYREPRGLVQAACSELQSALDPRSIAQFSAAQYRRKDFPFTPFDQSHSMLWAKGERATDGGLVHVLSDLVYSESSLRTAHGMQAFYWRSNSSGCAAGTTMADARLAGLLELVERDGFMRHWLAQEPGVELMLNSLPQWLGRRVASISATGFTVSVQILPSRFGQVAFLFASHPKHRVTCVSSAAKLTLEDALDSALAELESRAFTLLNGYNAGNMAPSAVVTPEDHFALYANSRYYQRADNLAQPLKRTRFSTAARLDLNNDDDLYNKFLNASITPIFVDITPARNGIGDGGKGLAVARAFAPGLLPMSFGAGLEPRGMVATAHAASAFPHPFA